MAVTKIFPIKATIAKASNYIQNLNKTADQTLISTYECNENRIEKDFLRVINNSSTQRTVLARHLIQSFKPHEVDPDTAHKIAEQLCEKHLQGKYQYIISTHIDRDHIHNHILFNNVSFQDYTCYNSNKRSYKEIRQTSDNLCREYGLSVIEEIDKEKTKFNPHATKSKYENTYRDQIRTDIDLAIKKSPNFKKFREYMEKDYEIKEGKYTAYRHKTNGQKRFIRSRSLGTHYKDENIKLRIEREFLGIKDIPDILERTPDYNVINLDQEKFKENTGLRYWALQQNNKAIGNTIYRMRLLGAETSEQLLFLIEQSDNQLDLIDSERNKFSERHQEISELKELLHEFIDLEKANTPEHHIQAVKIMDDLLEKGIVINNESEATTAISELEKEINELKANWKDTHTDYTKELQLNTKLKSLANNYARFRGEKTPYYEVQKSAEQKEFEERSNNKQKTHDDLER